MRDLELWHEILAAPPALASPKKNLAKIVGRHFGLTASSSAIALQEYRKFLYLVAVSKETLVASPLIDFIWEQHTKQPRFEPDKVGVVPDWFRPRVESRIGPHADPAYQKTLDIYRQEFGALPMQKVWPPVSQLRRIQKMKLGLLIVFWLSFVAVAFKIGWLAQPVFALCFGAGFWILFFDSYWGSSRPGD